MTRDSFDVKTHNDTIKFLRSMYNFKSVVRDGDAMWDRGKEALCRDLCNTVQELPALTSHKTSNPRSTALSIDQYADPLSRQGYRIYQYSTLVCAF